MDFLPHDTKIDFIGKRRLLALTSAVLVIGTLVLLIMRGLNFGLDFTGGTLVELSYREPANVVEIRSQLGKAGFGDAVVQRFGTTRDLMVRLPLGAASRGEGPEDRAAATSQAAQKMTAALRAAAGEREADSRPGQAQRCVREGSTEWTECSIQVRRVEFVGPQVGEELAWKGGYALLFSLIGIFLYVIVRFEWRFALGVIAATVHDVLLVFGFFALTQMEFDLSVLAAILAVLGYSVNDTVVVFDRIRENFRKMRRADVVEIMNTSVNQTLSRTIITSGTTLLTMLALYVYGGEILYGFSVAMIVGIVVGTYSSIFIATPVTLALGITREDMMPVKKEGAEATP